MQGASGVPSAIRNPQSKVRNRKSEAGASLVEILVAIGILALALVVFIAGLSTGSFAVRASNRLTTANNLAAAQLETIKGAVYNAGGAYPLVAAPPGYAISLSSSVISTGLQQMTVTVSYAGGAVVVSNYKVDR
jgi:type II secretory pathway pseudopilin PulG